MRNQVQLIAYADRLGGSIPLLDTLLRDRFPGVFGGVHLLPFFTRYDGADAGFDPIDHTEVDPRLGTWQDLERLGARHDTIADVIINHMSAESAQFLDFRTRGADSPWAEMFLTLSSVFPDGATERDLTAIFRPRPGLPFTPVSLGGIPRLVWTTFTPAQVDLDVKAPRTLAYLTAILDRLRAAGVAMVRLDAVGYAVKTPGTSCFMTPETFEFIAEAAALVSGLGMEVLVEVHSYYQRQIEIGRLVDRVYDFALPPLLLHAAHTGDHSPLLRWLPIRPANAITVLDTHDGIGIIDVGPGAGPGEPGLLTAGQISALTEAIQRACGGESIISTRACVGGHDTYQVNSTYYDALGRDDRSYLAARAVQFFTPGVPQVYYVGALAGHNDVARFRRTGVQREINRHVYTDGEVDEALRLPVVRALVELARFRNSHPAFGGRWSFRQPSNGQGVTMTWTAGEDVAGLTADLGSGRCHISWSERGHIRHVDDLLDIGAFRS